MRYSAPTESLLRNNCLLNTYASVVLGIAEKSFTFLSAKDCVLVDKSSITTTFS